MQFRSFFAFGSALLPVFAAAHARAEEPTSPVGLSAAPAAAPASDLPPRSARINLMIGGAATSLVSYGLALSASFLVDQGDYRGAKDLRIPFAGPWIALGRTGCPTSDPNCSVAPLVVGAILATIDGVAQAGGLGILGEGLFLNTSSRKPQRAEGPTVHAVPFNFGKNGVGLGVFGTF